MIFSCSRNYGKNMQYKRNISLKNQILHQQIYIILINLWFYVIFLFTFIFRKFEQIEKILIFSKFEQMKKILEIINFQ